MFNNRLRDDLKELKEQLHSLTQVKESLDQEMLVVILNPQGVITSVNQKFTDDLGISQDAVIGKNISELAPTYSRETDHYKALLDSIKGVKHWAGALEIEKQNGGESWLRVILQPVLNGDGSKLKEFSLHCNDLTRTITRSRERSKYYCCFTAINCCH